MTVLRTIVVSSFILLGSLCTAQNWVQEEPATAPPSGADCGPSNFAFDSAHAQAVLLLACLTPPQTWVWNGWNWTQKFPTTNPTHRTEYSMAFDSTGGYVFLFGGFGDNVLLNDTWVWDGVDWRQLTPKTSPPGRFDAGMAYDASNKTVVLFGGSNNGSNLTDTWVWNGTTWKQAKPKTTPPDDEYMMAYDTGTRSIILYGNYSQQTYAWTGANWDLQSSSASPPPRIYSAIADDPAHNQVIVFSGYVFSAGQDTNDTWAWNGRTWTDVSSLNSPTPREIPSMTPDPANGQVLLFGGFTDDCCLDDTWAWSQYPLTNSPLKGTSGESDIGLNPYTIPIITAFDHSMANNKGEYSIYGFDGVVEAFTSESGSCSPKPSCAAKQDAYANASKTAFGVNGHYVGDKSDGGVLKLEYEGHPGFDYYASCTLDKNKNCILKTGTNVYAVASGQIHYPDSMTGLCSGSCASKYHVLQLLPSDAPYLHIDYLHLSTYGGTSNPTDPFTATDPSPALGCPSTVTLPLAEGTVVGAGCLIAQSGNTSESFVGPHLHLEVQRILPETGLPANTHCTVNGVAMACVPVDPYGSTCGIDPYFSLIEVPNIPLWNFPSYLSADSLCFGPVPVGSSDQQEIRLTNVAPKPLSSLAISLTPAAESYFSQTNNCGTSLVPGQSCEFTVTFSPAKTGATIATLTITGRDNSSTVSPNLKLVVSLSGNASR